MGLFGGDEKSDSEKMMEEQYNFNRQELELKKQNLYKTRLEIIKGQGQQTWTPDMGRQRSRRPAPIGQTMG